MPSEKARKIKAKRPPLWFLDFGERLKLRGWDNGAPSVQWRCTCPRVISKTCLRVAGQAERGFRQS